MLQLSSTVDITTVFAALTNHRGSLFAWRQ